MWKTLKRWFAASQTPYPLDQSSTPIQSDWVTETTGNRFPVRYLEIRAATQGLISATSNEDVAKSFCELRCSDGNEFRNQKILNSESVDVDLCLKIGKRELGPVIFQADVMETKWDIYFYDSTFLFVRSWTGDLRYRAFCEVNNESVRITRIESSVEAIATARQAVYFLLISHWLGKELPHTIPAEIPDHLEAIIGYSFGMFGVYAHYATYEDNTKIKIDSQN